MIVKRGEIWFADSDPVRGSEQGGKRPVLVLQNEIINRFTTTVLAVPLTTNLQRAVLPSSVLIPQGEGGLLSDSVALGHQLRVYDQTRLLRRVGKVGEATITAVEQGVLYALGMTSSERPPNTFLH